IIKTIINGIAFLAIVRTDNLLSELATNKFNPKGGVTKPIAKDTTIIIPKCIGSIPIAFTTGKKIGAKIKIAGVVSMTIPIIKRNKMITKIIIILLYKLSVSVSAITCGAYFFINVFAITDAVSTFIITTVALYIIF